MRARRKANEIEWDRGVGFLAADITRLMTTHYNRMIKPMGLTPSQWRLVLQLYREDGLSQSDLARLIGVGKVSMGRLVDGLEEADWVERREDPNDRRSKLVYLTRRSAEMDGALVDASIELYHRTTEGLSPKEIREMERLLGVVRANLQSAESA